MNEQKKNLYDKYIRNEIDLSDLVEEAYTLGYNANFKGITKGIRITSDPIADLCPLTNSSHEKALVRVVEKPTITTPNGSVMGEFIQVLCSCGHIISENEIK